MAAEALNRYGELTHLGALQHRQIAYRMEHRFPEIFADTTATIQARSTVVIRCILSMENELQELLRNNSRLKIDCDASEHDMYYMNNYKDTMVQLLQVAGGSQGLFRLGFGPCRQPSPHAPAVQ